jgi:DNA-binding IclR family transcriptional regulator
LGPRAYALTASGPYRQELLDLVVQPMRALARSFDGLGVVVAELKPHGQQVIWECGAFRRPDIGLGWIEQTPWHGTCCRVLVANLPAPQRRRWIDRNGLPNPTQWPGLADRTDLLSALADIRRAGVATAHIRPYAQVSAAVHLHLGAEHVAIGVYGPDSIDEQSLAQALRDCAECRIKTLQTTTR